MSHRQPKRVRTRSTSLAGVAIIAALAGVLGGCSTVDWLPAPGPSTSAGGSPEVAELSMQPSDERPRSAVPGELYGQPQLSVHPALGLADGEIPDGVTVFDEKYPAVSNLDPALLDALRQAARTAGGDGVEFFVNSGWRSPAYQEQLLDEAVSKYGSLTEAARWVATPATSAHVSGDAVDIGRSGAIGWLSERGFEYGLCQIFRNEPWHYEMRPETVDHGCPAMYADPTHDPRMQQ